MENFEKIQEFSSVIFDRVSKGNVEYIDAILTYCEETEIDVDLIVDLISPPLQQKIEEEALISNLIKSSTHKLTKF